MAVFIWEGKTRQGEQRAGTMEAPNADIVIERLRAQQIQASKVKKKPIEIHIKIGTGISAKEIVVFTRQFATMIDAGLPLVQCLEILASQQTNVHFQKVINTVKSDVESGSTLADALGKHPKVFDELYVNLVAAGEVGGILDTILNRLATYMEKNLKLRSGRFKVRWSIRRWCSSSPSAVTFVLLVLRHSGVREDVPRLRRNAANTDAVRHRSVELDASANILPSSCRRCWSPSSLSVPCHRSYAARPSVL